MPRCWAVALEGDLAQPVHAAFFDRNGDIDGFSGSRLNQGNVRSLMSGVANLGLGVAYVCFEIATILVLLAHALGIFIELGGVISPGEYVFEENGMRNADRPQILHRTAQDAALDVLVAVELDLSDFDLGAFFDHERDAHRSGGNISYFCANGCKLAAVFGEQLLDGIFGFLDTRRIVLAFDHQPNLLLLESVENIAVGNSAQADVVDLTDRRLLLDLNDEPPAFGRLFAQKLDVLEISRVPQRIEVAFQRSLIVNIAGLGEDAGEDSVFGDAAISDHIDFGNDVALRPRFGARHEYQQSEKQPPRRAAAYSPPRS
jgi:hypothetical protein